MPEELGRYVLERRLATGGMAEVFLAKQTGAERFERPCVVKRLLPQLTANPDFVEMFLDEAKLAAQLTHPNIAQVYDFGQHEGVYFLAMEYVPGADLKTVIADQIKRKEYVSLPVAARIVSQAALALDYAHQALSNEGEPLNIVHRDVSPQNILVGRAGAVKLIDFGIAKAAGDRQQTRAGLIKGKFAYMSPEQVTARPLDGRSDIFSLGLVFYELLANRQAIMGDSAVDMMEVCVDGKWTPIHVLRPDLPPELRAVVERALQVDRERRYAHASEMSADLERYLASLGTPVSPRDLAALAEQAAPRPGSNPRAPAMSEEKRREVEAQPTAVIRQPTPAPSGRPEKGLDRLIDDPDTLPPHLMQEVTGPSTGHTVVAQRPRAAEFSLEPSTLPATGASRAGGAQAAAEVIRAAHKAIPISQSADTLPPDVVHVGGAAAANRPPTDTAMVMRQAMPSRGPKIVIAAAVTVAALAAAAAAWVWTH